MSETFLAFKNAVDGTAEIEAAVSYDIAAEVDQTNHWFEEGEMNPQLLALMLKVASRGLYELFAYCFVGRALDEKGMRIAMRRFVSVAWLLHSEMLVSAEKDDNGNPRILTLEELSKLPQLDCTRCAMSIHAQNFGKRWNFHARVQKRQGSKTNYAASAKTGWAKRRARAAKSKARKGKQP